MKKMAIITLIGGMLAGTTMAASLSAGSKELGLSGFLDFDSDSDTRLVTDIFLGKFLTDFWEVGVDVGLKFDDDITHIDLGLKTEYNFDIGNEVLYPFVGLGVNYIHSEVDRTRVDEDVIGLDLDGGVKYFVTEPLAISSRVTLDVASDDVFLDDRGADNTDWVVDIGLRYFFD